jgi:acetyl esterase/lipase
MKRFYFFLTLLAIAALACGLPSKPSASTQFLETATQPQSALSEVEGSQDEAAVTQSPPTDSAQPPVHSATNNPPQQNPRGNSATPSMSDVTYCTMDGVALKMDLYYPAASEAPLPVTMYVHGGGWSKGDKAEGAGAQEIPALQNAGFLVVSVNYRLAPEYPFPAMIQDIKCAVRYLRAQTSQYNLDPNRIGVWGGSAGGHLVNLLGTTDESVGFDVGEYLEYSSRVQAVVSMFGPTDLTVQFEGGYEGASRVFDGFDAALASPVAYVSADDPPFLMLHGDTDKLVPIEQSQILLAALQSVGVPAELVTVINAGHSFKPVDGKTISPSRKEITQMVVEFFELKLK